MKTFLNGCGVAGALLFATFSARAQAPANDAFANAIPLNGPIVTATGNNVGATKQFGQEPNIAGNFGGASVWWTWTATASGPTTIDTMGSSFNTLLGVYTGNAGNQLTLIGSNNDYSGNPWSRVDFTAVAGTVYRIVVDGLRTGGGFGTVATGNITLRVQGVGGITVDTPANGMVFTVGDPIPVNVTITPDFPNPPVTRIDFYRGVNLFASSLTPPYSAVASNTPAGTNAFYVIAYDSNGMPVQSSVVNVFVQTVGVTLLTPFEDTVFPNLNPITVTAWAYLPAGSITNVEFFVDGVKFGEDATPPFSGVWSNVVGGSHRFTALGRSDADATYNSQPVNVGVATTLIATGAVWKYLDNGTDQGTGWITPDFDDYSWKSGAAELGYGDTPVDEATIVEDNGTPGYVAGDTDRYITTYFRRTFVVSNAASFASLTMALERDDGGVVYLNGREVFRSPNMPAAPAVITYTTLTTDGNGIEDTIDTVTLNATNFVVGTNVFAVEIHQASANSSDISFNLGLVGVPVIIHNLSPEVALTNPPNNSIHFAPAQVTLEASASDADGAVAKVEFFDGNVKIGEDTDSPYSTDWYTPSVGPHVLTAVATDEQGASQRSSAVNVMVFDAVGTPFAQITAPADGATFEGPTNLLISAFASAVDGATNVEFFVNEISIGSDTASPYSIAWNPNPLFGTNALSAVAYGADGRTGTSVVTSVIITIPPTNVIAPTIATQNPVAGASITNILTNVVVTFSERVQGVDAADLRVNGVAATAVTGSFLNYTFTVAQPAYGPVTVTFAGGHGITDFGYPADLAFDEAGAGATWTYTLLDRLAPTITTRVPAAGALVTNLSQISVTFSESVGGVDAADLLVAGTPAASVTGGGASYTFNVAQPAAGTVNVTWTTTNGIYDLSGVSNAFNGAGAGATWSFTLDTSATLVQSNSAWRFLKGYAEASSPADAWRQRGFDDASWSNSPAPFYFGDPYTNASIPGTLLSDMLSNYTTIFLRQEFTVANRGIITNLFLSHQSDDGFVAWLNGVEVWRHNVPAGELPYNAIAAAAANEPSQSGAAYIAVTLTNNPVARLRNGTNVLAIQALNQNLTNSSDFGFNARLYFFATELSNMPPRLVEVQPAAGDVNFLTNITMFFSEPVTGVNAGDLLVNGLPAAGVVNHTNTTYTFSFAQPPFGPVLVTWLTNHGIVDFDSPPKPFDGAAAASTAAYSLINISNPKIAAQTPPASTTVTGLTSLIVTFNEPVMGVEAADLLVSGAPAATVDSGDNTAFLFSFPQPPFGAVTIRWATNHGITDIEAPPNEFDPTRFGGQWNYTLIDPVPSVTITTPTNNTFALPPANVTIQATATDNDGTVTVVEFYEGEIKIGQDTNAPYALALTNLGLGAYVFRAVATDNQGQSRTSAPAAFNVVTSLPIALVRGPYLQVGTTSSGIVRWRTDVVSDGVVYYGTDVDNLTNVAVQAVVGTEHVVQIAGLEVDTQYFYSIGSGAYRLVGGTNDGANYWFKTSPPVGTQRPVRFWALGDAGTAGNGAPDRQQSTRNAFYNYAATNGPADLWLMLGDNAYNSGTDAEHQAAVFNMYPATLRNLFLWPTIGNHETAQSTTAATFPYLDIFSLPTAGEAGGVASGTEKYYSFDYANIHFICLDSMTSGQTDNTPMANWLKDDLASTLQEWIIVFFHHPPYTKGSHNSDTEQDLVRIRQNLVPILETNGVDLVLGGHSHCYERSYLLNGHYGLSDTFTAAMQVDGGNGRETGDGAYKKSPDGAGTSYVVAGSSGQATFLQGDAPHEAMYLTLLELGSLVVDVASNRMDVVFLDSVGAIRDKYTIFKQTPPAAPDTLIARALDASHVWLTWTDHATNEYGYYIERSTDGSLFTRISTNAPDTDSLLESGLLANTTYFYRVRSFNNGGESAPSNVASVTTVTGGGVPVAPNGLLVSAGDGGDAYRSRMVLRWRDRSANEAGFLIERSRDGDAYSAVGTVGANSTAYVDHGLASASYYYYRVRSFNASGDSTPSNPDNDQTHPQDNLVMGGDTAEFHAGVEGTPPIRYQWRFLDAALPGETNETLTITDAQPADEGEYTVVVTDGVGVTTSNPAWLFVFAPPFIVSQPSGSTNLAGTSVTFTVAADGTGPLFYQWRKNGVALPGAVGVEFTIAAVVKADEGDYDVVVANNLGAVASESARLAVNLYPVPGADLVQAYHNFTLKINAAVLLANDTDPDGDALSVTGVGAASSQGGTLALNGGQVWYTPPPGFDGSDTFSYAITDARGAGAIGLVSLTVLSNAPPVLPATPDLIVDVLTPLALTLGAADADAGNRHTYAFQGVAPFGATLNPSNGTFQWTPARNQAPGTNLVTVRVADNGVPPLGATQSFTVIVKDYIELTIGSATVYTGESNGVPVDFFTSARLTNLQCELHFDGARLSNLGTLALAPLVATPSLEMLDANSATLTFTALPGQFMQGTQQLARLTFTAVPDLVSTFMPLTITTMNSARAVAGLTPTPLMNDGRLVLVGGQPLVEARITGNNVRQVTIYGRTNVNYTLQQATNLVSAPWTTRGIYSLTDRSRVINVGNTTSRAIYYRVRQ